MMTSKKKSLTKCFSIYSLLSFLIFHTSFSSGQISRQWAATYNGIGDFNDHFNCITTDASGNIYLGGYTVTSDNERDYLVVKLNSSGTLLWSKVFAGSSQGRDEATAIKLDASGNVFVTGFLNQNITGTDYYTMKMNSNGDTLWTASYNYSSAFGYDQANDLSIDNAGNVFVTGFSDADPSSATNEDYLTVRYNASGVQQWTQRYNGTGNATDKAVKILIDPTAQYVYITGRSDNGTNDDYVTIKYDYNGLQQWRVSGNRGGRDRAVDMAMDATGNIYVTGRSSNGADDDYWTLKYTTTGTVAWQIAYDYVETDRPLAMAIDGSGNIYVTGQSDGDATSLTNYDYLTVKYSGTGAQVWVMRWDSPILQSDIANDITVNGTGTVFVTGISDNDVNTAIANTIVTIAYNATNGSQSWINSFNLGTNPDAEGNVVATLGNGCVAAGFVQTTLPNSDAIALDYDSNGNTAWNYTYNGQGNNNENIHSIIVDNSNNVYACGYIVETDQDRNMAMMKFNSSGNFVCQKTVDGTSSGSTDDANGIVFDLAGNPFVAGYVDNSQNSNDIAYFKSNPSTCDTLFYLYYNAAAGGSDKAYDIVRDAAGNVYMTGRVDMDPSYVSNQDCFTAKLGTNGNILWSKTFNQTATNEDRGSYVRLGVNGEVFVAGRTYNGSNYDILLLCYTNAGTLLWSQTYNGGANDFNTGIVLDANNNAYLCGRKETAVSGVFDYVTLKYNAAGVQQWIRTYDGTGSGDDEAQALAFNLLYGGPVVTGKSDIDPTANVDFDMMTIQYDSTGTVQWMQSFSGNPGGDDIPDDIAVAAGYKVLMTGHTNKSTALNPNFDIRTVMINSFTGLEEWADVYNGPSDSSDIGNQLFVNGSDFYVAGSSYNVGTQRDALVLKYNILNTGLTATEEINSSALSYPNPAGQFVKIIAPRVAHTDYSLVIYDTTGRRIQPGILNDNYEFTVDLTSTAEGVFTYLLTGSDGSVLHGKLFHLTK
jgi:uncharacterized delta-60 repeat protein